MRFAPAIGPAFRGQVMSQPTPLIDQRICVQRARALRDQLRKIGQRDDAFIGAGKLDVSRPAVGAPSTAETADEVDAGRDGG